MRLCFISAQYLPTVGGVERYTHSLAKKLSSLSHESIIITSSLEGLPVRETDGESTRVFRLPAYPLMGGRFPFIKPSAEFRALASEAFSLKPDVVIINNHFYSLSVWAARECAKRSVPAIMIGHGTQYLMTGAAPLAAAGKLYEHLCADVVKKRVSRCYGVSRACSKWLETFGIISSGEIYNAVDPDELEREAAGCGEDIRASLGLGEKTPMIAYSGRLIPEKGVLGLAEALKAIRAQIPNAAVVMAGGGALKDSLSALGQEGLYLLGEVSHAKSLALIKQADALCLPTRSEGFSGVVLEAAALGTPIITTPTGGSPELIPDSEHGLLIPDMRPETIARECVKALGDAQWRARAAQNAKSLLLSGFTWDKSAAALLEAARLAISEREGA